MPNQQKQNQKQKDLLDKMYENKNKFFLRKVEFKKISKCGASMNYDKRRQMSSGIDIAEKIANEKKEEERKKMDFQFLTKKEKMKIHHRNLFIDFCKKSKK